MGERKGMASESRAAWTADGMDRPFLLMEGFLSGARKWYEGAMLLVPRREKMEIGIWTFRPRFNGRL